MTATREQLCGCGMIATRDQLCGCGMIATRDQLCGCVMMATYEGAFLVPWNNQEFSVNGEDM